MNAWPYAKNAIQIIGVFGNLPAQARFIVIAKRAGAIELIPIPRESS